MVEPALFRSGERESNGRRILMNTTQDDILEAYEANKELEENIRRSSMRCKSMLVLQPAREC